MKRRSRCTRWRSICCRLINWKSRTRRRRRFQIWRKRCGKGSTVLVSGGVLHREKSNGKNGENNCILFSTLSLSLYLLILLLATRCMCVGLISGGLLQTKVFLFHCTERRNWVNQSLIRLDLMMILEIGMRSWIFDFYSFFNF